MPSANDLLPLWKQLDFCSAQLQKLHRLLPNQRRIAYWPGAEMHHVPTLVLCLHGQARLIYEQDQKLDLNSGEAVLIGPGIFHNHEKLRGGSAIMQQGLAPQHSDFHLQNIETHYLGFIPLDNVKRIFYSIIHDPLKATPAQQAQQHEKWLFGIESVCKSILNEHIEESRSVPRVFQNMFSYFVRYVHEGITVDDIIKASDLSRSQAYKLWTRYYGTPMREAISLQRLNLAKLLLQTELDLESIASRCGFSSRQQMTRLFQQLEHCSPRGWRQLQTQNPN